MKPYMAIVVGTWWLTTLLTVSATAEPTKLTVLVTDPAGKGMANVLLIVRSVERPGLGLPYLTDANGRSRGVDLGTGIHQIIASCPFGFCETTAYEFLPTEVGSELKLTVGVKRDKSADALNGTSRISSNTIWSALAANEKMNRSIIKAVDHQGSPFPDVLLIVLSSDDKKEIGRYLTDSSGQTPELQLSRGSYEVIATCPYGICETAFYSFSASEAWGPIIVSLDVKPSDEFGDIVGADRMQLRFYPPSQKQIETATILVRDRDAKWFRSYVIKPDEFRNIELLDDPTFITIVFDGRVVRKAVAKHCEQSLWILENGIECINKPKSATLTLDLK
jgi:hypothetical protein